MAVDASPYEQGPAKDIGEVLRRQEAIGDYIENGQGVSDGIYLFNKLYITITKRVIEGCDNNKYDDSAYMRALDVAFANRYFAALRREAHDPGSAPPPWNVLLKHRATAGIEELQFAAAGVNAHINYDLAAAVFETWDTLGLGQGAAEHNTYQAIDKVFGDEMDPLRKGFENGWEKKRDVGEVSKILDVLGDLAVDGTRDLAWHHARTMWKLRHVPLSYHLTMDWLSLTALAAGEVLLVPLSSLPN